MTTTLAVAQAHLAALGGTFYTEHGTPAPVILFDIFGIRKVRITSADPGAELTLAVADKWGDPLTPEVTIVSTDEAEIVDAINDAIALAEGYSGP